MSVCVCVRARVYGINNSMSNAFSCYLWSISTHDHFANKNTDLPTYSPPPPPPPLPPISRRHDHFPNKTDLPHPVGRRRETTAARSELHDRRGGKSVLYSLDLAKQICKLIAQNVLVAINSTFRRTHHRTPSFLTVPAPIGNTSDALSKSVFVVTDAHDNAQSFAFS